MTRSQKAGARRKGLSGAINWVAASGDRIVILQRGKPMAALVSLNDLRMLETLEDQLDGEAARKALADPKNRKRIPWSRVKATLASDGVAAPPHLALSPDGGEGEAGKLDTWGGAAG